MDYNNELYHWGVKGMKWGVRRYQNADGTLTDKGKKRYSNKEIRQDKKQIRKDLESQGGRNLTGDAKKAYDENQKLEKRINHLLENYEFDGDDGGGGRTAADRKAGAEYMSLNEKYYRNEHIIDAQRNKQVSQKLIDKYGEQRMNQFKTAENVKAGAAVAGVILAAPVALAATAVVVPAALVGAGAAAGYKSVKNKLDKRKDDKEKRKEHE